MNSVYILYHSYFLEGQEESKLIGVYSSYQEAESAIDRTKGKPGFKEQPEGFSINEYTLNHDEWTEGFSKMTIIQVKDINNKWKSVTASMLSNGDYEIIEKYENDQLGDFKDGDIVKCVLRDKLLYAIEKTTR